MSALRILSFNIHGGVDRKGVANLRRIHALMEGFDIDIGVLQEMETRPSRGGHPGDVEILCGNERPYRLLGPAMKEDGGWYGNLILSRFPIIRGLVHDLERKHQVLEPRNAVDALIETPKGRLRVIGTHLSLASILRRWEITNLIRLINMVEDKARSPVFFMGDFNEWLWSSRLLRHLDRLMHPLPCAKTFCLLPRIPARSCLVRRAGLQSGHADETGCPGANAERAGRARSIRPPAPPDRGATLI